MRNEFATQHSQIRIGLISMGNVSVSVVLGVWRRMEGVTRSMNADETHSAIDCAEKLLLSLHRHWRVFVLSVRRQIARRKEKNCGIFVEFWRIEDPALFGRSHIESVLLA